MSDSETERVWDYLRTLTKAVMQLSKATIEAVRDPKVLDRLQPFYDELRALAKIHAEHCAQTPAKTEIGDTGPSTDELLERLETLEEREEEREADKNRPVHVLIKKNGEDKHEER